MREPMETATEEAKTVSVSRVQMAAMVGVVSATSAAKEALLQATHEQELVLKEVLKELGFPEGATIKITPELQNQLQIQIQTPE